MNETGKNRHPAAKPDAGAPCLREGKKAVIFDMDGVITDTMPYHYRAWESVLAEEGIRVSHLDIYKREGEKGGDSLRDLFRENGRTLDDALQARLLKKKEDLFQNIVQPKLIRGSEEMIRRFHQARFVLALVTGTSRSELLNFLPGRLLPFFAMTLAGDEVRRGKPDPEPYRTVLERLALDSDRTVVVENAPFGIRSARAANLYCLAVTTSLPEAYLREAGASEVHPSMEDAERAVYRYFETRSVT
jgi:beta-phosphoglucomutase